MRITNCDSALPPENGKAAAKSGRLRRRIRRRAGSEQGSSLVEFAFVLPMFMLVITATFAFGFTLTKYMQLTNAVNVGGQLLAISRGNYDNPCTAAVNAIYNAAPNLVAGDLAFTFTFTNNGTSNQYTTASECDTAAEATSSPIFAQGESVQLIATYPCSFIGYGFNFSSLGCSMTAEVTEIVQ